ncbi:hypothetical protein M427DRAFT_341543 [Gonapodya prolifera JEL478]|uniref:VOC domain-containing protein n=1 Tax=Gonapodya prolifera (strain JEL478) TaxID=1344416 RepID=A0A139ACW7_GONPJ|nr:hypothetical protein M427DRAFT_341543 [Gonapodya prolifera JEL478]|eukprot:KXS14424.1 hypothetical protein M427DRAFT_341543 [Gonapodya prolifera JEL478]
MTGSDTSLGIIRHVEIPVKDLSRACAFYTAVFGWHIRETVSPDCRLWSPTNPKKTEGTHLLGGSFYPSKTEDGAWGGPQINIAVQDILATLEKVVAHGGKVVRERREIPNAPIVSFDAEFTDSEGNHLFLHELPSTDAQATSLAQSMGLFAPGDGSPIVTIKLPCDNPSRKQAFYEKLFDLRMQEWKAFGKLFWYPEGKDGDITPSGLPLQKFVVWFTDRLAPAGKEPRQIPPTRSNINLYFTTPDITKSQAVVTENGGEVITSETLIHEQIGSYAEVTDTEGDRFYLYKPNPVYFA